MKQANEKTFLYCVLSMFFVIRIHVLMIVALAQYLTSIFVFSKKIYWKVLLDEHLFFIVLSTFFAIASGFIINNFYDTDSDKINKPIKHNINNFIDQKTQLKIYFLFNFFSVILGSLVSFRAALFFGGFIFLIWLYSHKIKKYPLISVLWVTFLNLLPFFALLIYHKDISEIIILLACSSFFLIFIKQLLKLLTRFYGEALTQRQTIATKYGVRFVKILIYIVVFLSLPVVYILLTHKNIGFMSYYLYGILVSFFFLLICLRYCSKLLHYSYLYNFVKILIFLGVCSLSLL